MAKRKYECYVVATEYGEEGFDNYREAFSFYQRQQTATLYGETEYGDTEVIISK